MNLTEKRRAEKMVEDWKNRALAEIKKVDRYNLPSIDPPAGILRKRDQLAKLALELQSAGWNVNVHVVSCGPGGPGLDQVATISPCPDSEPVKAAIEAMREQRDAIADVARGLVGRIWSDEATFDEIVEAAK